VLLEQNSSIISNQIGMKFGKIVLQVNKHWLAKSDFWYDVVLSRWSPCHHCSSEWCTIAAGSPTASTWRANTNGLAGCPEFLINSILIFVLPKLWMNFILLCLITEFCCHMQIRKQCNVDISSLLSMYVHERIYTHVHMKAEIEHFTLNHFDKFS